MARKKKVTINQGGLGDTVANVLKKTGIAKSVEIFMDGKDCGCDKRKEKLNQLFPSRYSARCLTEQEYNEWKAYREVRTLKVKWEQVLYICKLYADIFNKPYWIPECTSCTGTTQAIIRITEMIDKVYDTYENN